MLITLRPKQLIFKNDVYSDWNHGSRNVLGVKPTGSGKSVVVSDMVLDGVNLGQSQSIIAHRNELVSQMSVHIANRGIPHRIIGSNTTISQITRAHRKLYGRSFINPSSETSVVGVDTLIARKDDLADYASKVDKWYIDEAHHVLRENKWGQAADMFTRAIGLGVTATPERADGQGLGREYDGLFDTMVLGPEMREIINDGHLADFEIVCPKSDIMIEDEATGKNGDWSTQKLKKAAKKSRIVGDVVTAYTHYAYGKQAICFATDVETAGDIAKNFNNHGIRAVALSAKTNPAVREKYIQEFRDGKLMVLVNVDLFDEGFDVPACEVVIMARPTASLGKYRQMAGRALRTADGKLYGLIIDHVSNVVRHGLPDKYIAWTLARREKRGKQQKDPDELDLTVCKHCTKPYEPFRTVCPYCHLPPPLPAPQDRTLEQVDGDLILLTREMIEQMRRATEIESPGDVAARVGGAAGKFAGRGAANRQIEKIASQARLNDAIAQWAAVERMKGFDDREIHKKFYLATGSDVLTALDGSQKRQDFDKLAERIESWYTQ